MIKKLRALAVVGAALGFLLVPAADAFATHTECPSGPAAIRTTQYTATQGTVWQPGTTSHEVLVPGAAVRTFNDMTGNVLQNDILDLSFTLYSGCRNVQVTLAAYKTTGPEWDPATADQQELHDWQTGTFSGAGPHHLQVHVAECFFQTDLARGAVIQRLGEDGLYGSRLRDADNGGTRACTGVFDPDPNDDADPSEEPAAVTPTCQPGEELIGLDTDGDGEADTFICGVPI